MPDLNAFEKAVYGGCISEIVDASNGAINKKDAKLLLQNLNTVKQYVAKNNPNVPIKSILPSILNQVLQQIKVGKLQKSHQQAKQRETMATNAKVINAIPKASDQLKALYGMMLGTYDQKNGGRYSTDVQMSSAVGQALGRLEISLREHNLLDHFTQGIDEDKVALELNQLTLPKGKPGLTQNKDAQKVAQIIHDHRAILLSEAARASLYVPELQGYTSQQTHDPDTIREAGFDKWFSKILPRLDTFQTFGMISPSASNWEAAMKNKYLNIISGQHQDYDKGVDTKYAPIGTNLAAKAAAQRTIHFKTAQDAYEYSKEFGIRSFREQVVASAASLARRTALANQWGPNAEMGMNNMLKLIGNNARLQEDKATLEASQSRGFHKTNLLGTPQQLMSEVLGKTRSPAQKNFWYAANQWLVALRSSASLGTATISAQTDLINLCGHLAAIQGNNPIMHMARVASHYYAPRNKDMDTVARQCGIMAAALRQQLTNDRFGDQDTSGWAGKLASFYFRLNGLHWHDQKITNVAAVLMANHFGEMAGTAHSNLPMAEKTWFARYGIGQREWDAMREHAFTGQDGYKYLTPIASDSIDNDKLKLLYTFTGQLSKFDSEAKKDELRNKFTAMFQDAANSTVPRAGARERLFAYRGTAANTPLGMILRLAFMFKTFPIAMISKIFNRNAYGQSTGKIGAAASLAMTIALTIILGGGIYALKQYITGKSLPDLHSMKGLKTLAARSITAGGGLGYLGDIALPEDDKEGLTANIVKGAAGPILSDAATVADTANQIVKGKATEKSLGKTAVNLGSNYVPFSNHFATRFLFNYYFKYAILNAIDPDYTNRMEKNMKKNDGSHFLGTPAVNASH